jgi:hypothetical protein
MNQKELNKLYKQFEDDSDDADFLKELRKHMKFDSVVLDYKEFSEEAMVLIKIMKKHEINVLENPWLKGSDTYGWFIEK